MIDRTTLEIFLSVKRNGLGAILNEQQRELVVAARRMGYSKERIAGLFGCSPETVKNIIRDAGAKGHVIPAEKRSRIEDAVRSGLNVTEIKRRHGSTGVMIKRIAAEAGLTIVRYRRPSKPKPKSARQVRIDAVTDYLANSPVPVRASALARVTGVAERTARRYAERSGKLRTVLNSLTDAQRDECRQLYATGQFGQWALAGRYGVNQSTISRAVRGVKKIRGTPPPAVPRPPSTAPPSSPPRHTAASGLTSGPVSAG